MHYYRSLIVYKLRKGEKSQLTVFAYVKKRKGLLSGSEFKRCQAHLAKYVTHHQLNAWVLPNNPNRQETQQRGIDSITPSFTNEVALSTSFLTNAYTDTLNYRQELEVLHERVFFFL